jgi:hypothetical protein
MPTDSVFISWSGEPSKTLARLFYEWLPTVVQTTTCFYSQKSMNKGASWWPELNRQLRKATVGVFFITKENAKNCPMMMYEAGAIGGRENCHVCTVLVDLTEDELCQPYPFFQCTVFGYDDFLQLVKTINSAKMEPLVENALEGTFRSVWPEFKQEWEQALQNYKARTLSKRETSTWVYFKSDSDFSEWIYRYHDLIHIARDLCVKILALNPSYDRDLLLKVDRSRIPFPHPLLERFRPSILNLLIKMVDVFRTLLPEDAQVWVCLRDLRGDGNFWTFERAGKYQLNRDMTTAPMSADCEDIKLLREQFSSGNCVIITGEGKAGWHSQPNDDLYHESKSVIMGAVLVKKMEGDTVLNDHLRWVLCVNSRKEDIFTNSHKYALQGCNDAFSAIANVMFMERGRTE